MIETPFTNLIAAISNLDISIWDLAKVGVLVGLFLYLGFAIMVVRQVDLMSRALDSDFNQILKALARLYFLLAIFVFLVAVVSL